MGRGNVCTLGPCEGLYYIDNDHIHQYGRFDESDDLHEVALMADLSLEEMAGADGWEFDELGTELELDDILECFMDSFHDTFRSFDIVYPDDKWLHREKRILMENKLFYVCMEDNQWSVAIELIQKEGAYDDSLQGLQKRHYERYLEGMKRSLLRRLPSIGTYGGAWCSGKLSREEVFSG